MSKEVKGTDCIYWAYPDIYGKEGPRDFLRISLYHVRAANDLQIEYDSDRDGWVIYMTTTTGYEDKDGELVPMEVRREKAFIPAWDEDEVVNG